MTKQPSSHSAMQTSGRGAKRHDVKILKEYYDAKRHGLKPFEVRSDDRGYEVNDTVSYTAYENDKPIPNCPKILTEITFVLRNYKAVRSGWVVYGEKVIGEIK